MAPTLHPPYAGGLDTDALFRPPAPEWQRFAACRGSEPALFHGTPAAHRRAQFLCRRCPVAEIYTQVSIRALKAIHTATHPGATNSPHRSADHDDDPERTDDAEELLDALDTEAAEEHDDEPSDLPMPIEDNFADGQPVAPADGHDHGQGPSERPDGG